MCCLPLVQMVFRTTTAMKLLELCDANRPLLRRLAQEASGTFNHSLTVGIMSEAAGNAIGADGPAEIAWPAGLAAGADRGTRRNCGAA